MSDDFWAVVAVLDSVQDAYRDRIGGGIARLEGRPESWGFAGARTGDVMKQLRCARAATTARSPRLLECGSGFGFVAALAREVGFTVTGVEIHRPYIELSRLLFPAIRVEETDLLTFDRFGEFDVIYYYGPFADDEVQARFERRVEADLRPGGIVLASRKVTDDWQHGGAFELLSTDGSHAFVLQKRG